MALIVRGESTHDAPSGLPPTGAHVLSRTAPAPCQSLVYGLEAAGMAENTGRIKLSGMEFAPWVAGSHGAAVDSASILQHIQLSEAWS
jgi:hypothetical protein